MQLVVNRNSSRSRRLGDFYAAWHGLAPSQICRISTLPAEDRAHESIGRADFEREIQKPLAACLLEHKRVDTVHYLVLTQGIPIRVLTATGDATARTDQASVDSELTRLYGLIRGEKQDLAGPAPNPFFRQRDVPFSHPRFPMYLVTRLAGYSFEQARASVERCRGARNRGVAVLDLKSDDDSPGNDWLRNAAILLPPERVQLESTTAVLERVRDVIAYASWGSNDPRRRSRQSGMAWLPGAIAAEYVSTNARTFDEPPRTWTLGNWKDQSTYFASSPQSMILDYIYEGVSGISGATDEPFLQYLPHPDLLFRAYLGGRNLAESFYQAAPALSWQIMILGDPLCRLQ